jgi:serpin B
MTRTDQLNYTETSNYQAASVPYGDGSTSMWIVLPKTGHTIDEISKSINDDTWKTITNSGYSLVELHLPKFQVDTSSSLNGDLAALGINSIFSESADFRSMSDTSLFVSNVYHKATLDVDEKGTVATAVTTIVMTASATAMPHDPPKPIIMRVDHPFLCVIQENKSGAILFIGAIQALTSPTE